MRATGWAFGKAILLGEHAVVHGHPALAAAVDCMVRCRAMLLRGEPEAAGASLEVPAWGIRVRSTDLDHPVGAALAAILAGMDAVDLPLALEVETELPAGAGLGSSAALAVAIVRAIAGALGRVLDAAEVAAIANRAERQFHSNPSGVDVALASHGGIGLFRRGVGLELLDVAPLTVAIGLSGEPRSTATMVGRVAEALRCDPAVAGLLAGLGDAALAGAEALGRGDLAKLGGLMTAAHATLAGLGVSSPRLDELVRLAGQAGALGAKLTGAGGGGAVLALAPGAEAAVVDRWRAAGFRTLVARLGVRPPDNGEAP
jgi:mevalonate kinase